MDKLDIPITANRSKIKLAKGNADIPLSIELLINMLTQKQIYIFSLLQQQPKSVFERQNFKFSN